MGRKTQKEKGVKRAARAYTQILMVTRTKKYLDLEQLFELGHMNSHISKNAPSHMSRVTVQDAVTEKPLVKGLLTSKVNKTARRRKQGGPISGPICLQEQRQIFKTLR